MPKMPDKSYQFRVARRKGAEFPVSLRKRRQWFAEDDLPPPDPPTDDPPSPDPPRNTTSLLADLQRERSKRERG